MAEANCKCGKSKMNFLKLELEEVEGKWECESCPAEQPAKEEPKAEEAPKAEEKKPRARKPKESPKQDGEKQ